MNKGAPMIGSGRFARIGGNAIQEASKAMPVAPAAPSTMLSRSPGTRLRM